MEALMYGAQGVAGPMGEAVEPITMEERLRIAQLEQRAQRALTDARAVPEATLASLADALQAVLTAHEVPTHPWHAGDVDTTEW